jgi:hypothetical protein
MYTIVTKIREAVSGRKIKAAFQKEQENEKRD